MIYGPPLTKQAATPVAGTALVNGTPTILSWTAPNDGLLHRVIVIAELTVSVNETGGNIAVVGTAPDGTVGNFQIYPGTQGTGAQNMSFCVYIVQAGSTFSIKQSGSLTGGAATLWAEIWGS